MNLASTAVSAACTSQHSKGHGPWCPASSREGRDQSWSQGTTTVSDNTAVERLVRDGGQKANQEAKMGNSGTSKVF